MEGRMEGRMEEAQLYYHIECEIGMRVCIELGCPASVAFSVVQAVSRPYTQFSLALNTSWSADTRQSKSHALEYLKHSSQTLQN
jgi:hypothetical protein